MDLHKANLSNLMSLWKAYGSENIEINNQRAANLSTQWPNRYWLEFEGLNTRNALLGSSLPHNAIVPIYLNLNDININVGPLPYDTSWFEKKLLAESWVCDFEQTAMYLQLDRHQPLSTPVNREFDFAIINHTKDISTWAKIGSEAFGYEIQPSVIQPLLNNHNIKILMAYLDGNPVACGLLFKSENVIGVHQVGVSNAFQGRGIARKFMHQLISVSEDWQGDIIVLQASARGKPLYDSLGFKALFRIKNYIKPR